jgi:hypothetical protein
MSGWGPRTALELAELRHGVMDALTVVWAVLTARELVRYWRARR